MNLGWSQLHFHSYSTQKINTVYHFDILIYFLLLLHCWYCYLMLTSNMCELFPYAEQLAKYASCYYTFFISPINKISRCCCYFQFSRKVRLKWLRKFWGWSWRYSLSISGLDLLVLIFLDFLRFCIFLATFSCIENWTRWLWCLTNPACRLKLMGKIAQRTTLSYTICSLKGTSGRERRKVEKDIKIIKLSKTL